MPVTAEEPRKSQQQQLMTQGSMAESLSKIAQRQTTIGDVEVKIDKLMQELDKGSSQTTVLKKLVQNEVAQTKESKKWKKRTAIGACVSFVLLGCTFGLMILSIQLSKDTYVAPSESGVQPMMTDKSDAVVSTSQAQRVYSLALATSLPDRMMKTITEITFTDPWNVTRSVDIVERHVRPDSVHFKSMLGSTLVVFRNGTSRYMEKDGAEYPICGSAKCAAFSAMDPTEEDLAHEMARRLLKERGLQGTANVTGELAGRLLNHDKDYGRNINDCLNLLIR